MTIKSVSILLSFWPLLAILVSCATSTAPHENFKSNMQYEIGKKANDPNARLVRYSQLVTGKNILLNGNIEVEFVTFSPGDRGDCVVYFEIDKKTNVIINWRYEGSEESCVIMP